MTNIPETARSHGTPTADYAIDGTLVAQLLAEQHPDLATLPLQLLEDGWDNRMFRLGEHLAIRMPRRASAATLIVNEQTWLPQLADRLTLPIPAPYRIGQPAHGYPWRWSIVPWLRGAPADLSQPAAAQAQLFATFLRSLHVPAPSDAPLNTLRGVALIQRADAVEPRMQRLANTTNLITPQIRAIWDAAINAPHDASSTWLHGDLHPRNILVDHGIITAVIDWGDLTAGDCATDLASIWMLFADPQARTQALAEYANLSNATLQRTMGWAIFFGVMLLDSGLIDDPRNALIGERTLQRVTIPLG